MTLFLVQLRERGGQPWSTPHVVRADDPETAARLAFPEPPSSLNVWDAYVVALAEPYLPTSVLIDVPKPKWGKARPANPQAREPQRKVEVEGVDSAFYTPSPDDEAVSLGLQTGQIDPALYDDRDLDTQVERERERAL